MKRAIIRTKSTVAIYEGETKQDAGLKATIIVSMCHVIPMLITVKRVIEWVRKTKDWYGKYFVILVDDVLTVRDRKNIDIVILEIDLSEMEA